MSCSTKLTLDLRFGARVQKFNCVMNLLPKQKGRKPKNKWRDPDKPKRPFSAYNLFAKSKYHSISGNVETAYDTSKRHSNQTRTMTQIAIEWKQLSEKDRAPFVADAAISKVEHGKLLEIYLAKKKTNKKFKKPKDKTKPKRCRSAYLFFNQAIRDSVKAEIKADPSYVVTDKHPETGVTFTRPLKDGERVHARDVMTELGRRWQQCQGAERKKYEEMGQLAKRQYDIDMAQWRTNQKNQLRKKVKVESQAPLYSIPSDELIAATEDPGMDI